MPSRAYLCLLFFIPASPPRPALAEGPGALCPSPAAHAPRAVAPAGAPQPAALDQAALLRRLIDLDRLASPPPAGEKTGMFSSFDRKSRIDPQTGAFVDWDANADWGQFIRTEDDGWCVMAEMIGPGAITRIWSANPQGQIRFILDGNIVVDAPFEDLFNGKLPPFVEPLCYINPANGGKNCYFPIGYAKSCKVVVRESKSYYQINYVAFPPSTPVTTFSPALDEAALTALEDVAQAWSSGIDPRTMVRNPERMLLTANAVEVDRRGRAVVEEIEGAGTIRALRIALTDRAPPRQLYALHKCVLRIRFDGNEQPNVEAPLVDFFGSGFDLRPFASLVLGTAGPTDMPMPGRRPQDQVFMYCYFPMPFRDGFRVEIENLGDRKIGFLVQTLVDRDVPVIADPADPPAPRLRFFARHRRVDPCRVLDYPILEVTGRGRIVGCLLNIDCPREVWWGEGDDKVWIDGEAFPSYFGTGSEDYLGDAWGLREHIRPVQGVTLKRPYGKNSAYRWHVSDCINFQKSVKFTIENWQFGGFQDTYYASIAYWYADPDARHTFEPLQPADLEVPGLRVPDAIEIEGRVQGDGVAALVRERYARGAELSGGQAVRITSTDPVTIDIPADQPRAVWLSLRVNPKESFDSIEVLAPDGISLATLAYSRDADGVYSIGPARLEAGRNLFTVRCAGAPVLDCWIARTVSIRSPHAREAEALKVVAFDRTNHTLQMLGQKDVSAGAHVWCRATEPGAWIEFELPVRAPGRYALAVVYTTSFDYGIVQTYVNGQKAGEPFDTFGDLAAGPVRDLGTFDLPEGAARIRCEVVGRADKSPGYYFGVDCFILQPAD